MSETELDKAETSDVSRGGWRTLYVHWRWSAHIVWSPEAEGLEVHYKCFQTLHFAKKKRKEKEEEEEDLRQFSRKILFLFSLISLPNTSKHLDSSLFSTITR